MTLFIILICILALILLVTWGKVNAFLAFLVVSLAAAFLLGVPLEKITGSVEKGLSDMLGSLVIIIVLGAMLGKLVAESGAAETISKTLMGLFGEKYIGWALMVTGLTVGIPLFYNVGFVLFVPLIFSVTYRFGLPAISTAIPMLAALSVTHGFLPPHPSPAALVAQFHANMGLTLIYGLLVSIPTIVVAGPLFAMTLKKMKCSPLETFRPRQLADDQLPGKVNSFLTALLPVFLLIASAALTAFIDKTSPAYRVALFFGDPSIVMLLSLGVATYTLGIRQRISMKEVMLHYSEAVKDISLILFIIAGAGALKQVFSDSGADREIAGMLMQLDIQPLLLGWMMAAAIRVCLGSATISGLTTAGIIAPLIAPTPADPNLMVLAIGAGSLMFSHVNDSGFWMFKQYFNVGIKDTIRSWSLMETIVAIMGIICVLILQVILHS